MVFHILQNSKWPKLPFSELIQSSKGPSVFGMTCRAGMAGACDAMLKECCDKKQFGAIMTNGEPSPLWLAANGGHAKVVAVLTFTWWRREALAPTLTQAAPDGTTPLEVAVARRHKDVVMALDSAYENLQRSIEFEMAMARMYAFSMSKPFEEQSG